MAYRYFITDFWNDPYIETLSIKETYLYIYFFTSPLTNSCGLYQISKKRISFDTRLSIKDVSSGIRKMGNDKKVFYKDDILWVTNFLRHQANKSPKVLVKIAKDLAQVGKHPFVDSLLKKYNTLSIPYQYPIDTTPYELELEMELEMESKGKKEKALIPFSEIITDLNNLLNTSYKDTIPKTRELIKARWNENHRIEDFKSVHRIKHKEWGNDPKMSKYLRPETLYGNKFESYLNQKDIESKGRITYS